MCEDPLNEGYTTSSGEEKSLNNVLDSAFTPVRTLGDEALKMHLNVQSLGLFLQGLIKKTLGGLGNSLYLSGEVLSAH